MKLKPGTRDYLAGVYVLGCTSLRVRRRFEALAAKDPLARAAVDRWTRELAGLAGWVPPVRPQPATLKAILARLEGRGAQPRWTGLGRALAAGIIGLGLALGWFYYASVSAPAFTAEIADAQGQAQWDFAAPADGRTLTVSVRQAHLVPANHDYEIWALPAAKGGKVVSLGLVPTDRDRVLRLTPAQRSALLGASKLALSEEPVGGSPTGVATGPIVHVTELMHRS